MQFEDLTVWKRSHCLAVFVYKVFCTSTDFGFKDQITRSALSVPSNIAEGYISNSERAFLISETTQVSKMLQGLIKSLR